MSGIENTFIFRFLYIVGYSHDIGMPYIVGITNRVVPDSYTSYLGYKVIGVSLWIQGVYEDDWSTVEMDFL